MSTDCIDPDLLRSTAEAALGYLEGLASRSVAPDPAAVSALIAHCQGPLAVAGQSDRSIVDELARFAAPATLATAGPRFFGFVIGGALPASLAASWLASTWDQNAFLPTTSPAGFVLEETALRWLRELLGLPECAGALVSGATSANFSALCAARRALLLRQGWDVERDGLFGAPPIDVIVSEESHPTVHKALAMLGLGSQRVRRVPTDDQGRLIASKLPPLSERSLVCVQAGNVNTGASDPFEAVCAQARDVRAWVHVDGAFGLWAAASPQTRSQVSGVDQADSWATDGHKWLNVPYDCGAVFVRDGQALSGALSIRAPYLLRGDSRQGGEEASAPGDRTPESSRRARGVEVYAALRSLGRAGAAGLVERCCSHAQRFAAQLDEAGFEILNEVVLNQVLVSVGDAEFTKRVSERIIAEGTCWVGPTFWRGKAALRISVSSWCTQEGDVDRSVRAMIEAAGGRGAPL